MSSYILFHKLNTREIHMQKFQQKITSDFHTSLRKAYKYDICHKKLGTSSPVNVEESTMKAKPDKTLDCLGLYCPEPVFRTRMELDEMTAGEVLEVLADDPAAEEDIKSLVKHLGQEIISINKEGNTVRILIKKVK